MSAPVITLRPAGSCQPDEIRPPALSAPEQGRLGLALRALADPSRLAIFSLIAGQDQPICACDIVSRFDLRQPTIAHHLKVLREAGLITAEKRGVWAWYAIDRRGATGVERLAATLLTPGRTT